jgi:hypothetical protein
MRSTQRQNKHAFSTEVEYVQRGAGNGLRRNELA